MKLTSGLLGVVVVAAAYLVSPDSSAEAQDEKKATRVFEMRTYYVHPGRMKAMHARFREHTCKLFEKHNMTLVGFWAPTDAKQAEQKLVYILSFPDRAAAEKSWDAFRKDPVWLKVKTESEKDGAIVAKVESVFLNPTDYSPVK